MGAHRPIAVFDSGVGGLTVLQSLMRAFEKESFLYLGDTARLPYGTKSPHIIRQYLEQNIEFLLKQRVKAIVVACNSASSVLEMSEVDSIPIYGVVQPGAAKAIESTQNGQVGILGTRATVQSDCYPRAIRAINSEVTVTQVACPLFVPFAEEGLVEDPMTNLLAYRYLSPLTASPVDTVVLGCTHYPVLAGAIRRVLGTQVELVESGAALATEIGNDFQMGRIEQNPSPSSLLRLFVTDENHNMSWFLQNLLAGTESEIFTTDLK